MCRPWRSCGTSWGPVSGSTCRLWDNYCSTGDTSLQQTDAMPRTTSQGSVQAVGGAAIVTDVKGVQSRSEYGKCTWGHLTLSSTDKKVYLPQIKKLISLTRRAQLFCWYFLIAGLFHFDLVQYMS